MGKGTPTLESTLPACHGTGTPLPCPNRPHLYLGSVTTQMGAPLSLRRDGDAGEGKR